MGKIYSLLIRPIRTFNIANRAEKVISQEKPIPAPQHASTERQKKLSDKVNPHFLEDHYRKNMQLDQRLKDVFVTSTDPQVTREPTRESKLLPQNRHSWNHDSTLEPYETTTIPAGKCSLKQALTFIFQHKQDPIKYNSENIASEYKIDKKIVDDILKYFKVYVIVSKENPEPMEDSFQQMLDHNLQFKNILGVKKKEKDVEEKK
ncbi:NADH dehydrogenase [ubiquinone] 1 alpha subcomplex assembly factor 4 [Monomorium pharaonis]|uniref:NADH dehydrogenase [ubiquinone] 1 alpha subcomplex assembly factor 4 n=1 Tax=Monomorium pharaonis TaxID=307658 RepID=UPI00063F80A9|nr:NADH dehydrogenase [ubiquinone] 1 alpha subcomplex assembly factor 4 [Monomorium pharaonis]XP_012539177.1 NADH dehydrogenase [ubiquinone] 1 alpha subcomplex assembly factor 4 [Monomorium pharaonis]XP_012539178.1 NADH dehydrogenase [ubiquinone] 1 alpha subcomplex assembly factor 4 [Monomorium pharaonis]XP_012539179.1 NADH dehydrogenase [ubiquinone] 1 alpha subcomplex assembly factor 4 [Monomorium pharaonis]XP_028050050.1 NADH dehydrogenase [ubiquinone] 1 alpha subcomplex assembly factor 4 [Mo